MTSSPLTASARFAGVSILTFALLAAASTTANAAVLEPVEVRFDVEDVDSSGFTTWTVPTNICAVTITAAGGDGGNPIERPGATPGRGAVIATRSVVAPGDVLTVAVGSRGHDGRPGGVPGGGTSYFEGGSGGGGWSGVATEAVPTQANLIVVAGAGGGAGNWLSAHGGDADSDAVDVWYEYGPATAGGGKAGTESHGGAGGTGSGMGSPGSELAGGMAASTGGGGGGGYFGGGGGSVNYVQSGGGGGSSFPFAGSADRLSYSIKQSTDLKDGWVTIAFDPTDASDTCMTPLTTATGPNGNPLSGQGLYAGDAFSITGTDWPNHEVVSVAFGTTPVTLGTATVASGSFAFSGQLPSDATSGPHYITITPTSSTLATVAFAVTVLPAAAASADELAATGIAGPLPPVVAAMLAGALVLGGGLFVLYRRPRRVS